MLDKDTTKSTFYQLFKSVCSSRFCQQLMNLEVNKYIKKLEYSVADLTFVLCQDILDLNCERLPDKTNDFTTVISRFYWHDKSLTNCYIVPLFQS